MIDSFLPRAALGAGLVALGMIGGDGGLMRYGREHPFKDGRSSTSFVNGVTCYSPGTPVPPG